MERGLNTLKPVTLRRLPREGGRGRVRLTMLSL